MKKKRVERKKQSKGRLHLVVLCAIVTVFAIVGVGLSRNISSKETKSLSNELIPSPYSQEEMEDIWTNHFKGILVKELFVGKFPLPKIQERFNVVIKRINERYHKPFRVQMLVGYLPESKQILNGSCLNREGEPTLEVVVPKLLDIYKSEQQLNEPGWEDKMRYCATIGFMHELDHLAFDDRMKGSRRNPYPIEQLADDQ